MPDTIDLSSHIPPLAKHIFLQGEKGCGKSSLIKNILAHISKNANIAGFYTFFNPISSDEKLLYLSPIQTKLGDQRLIMHWQSGTITTYNDTFESFGVKILNNTDNADIIIMDELGRFEQKCESFKYNVYKTLNGIIPILGVLQIQNTQSWLDTIIKHPNVSILHVTAKNRNKIEKILIEHFSFL